MKCPNCGAERLPGAEACPNCHVIFSKLEERAMRKALDAHTTLRREPVKDNSSPLPRLFTMFLATAAIYFFLEYERRKTDAAENLAAAQTQTAAQPPGQQAQLPAAPPTIKNPWKFEGRVFDLLRDKPIAGVKLVFSAPRREERFSAETGLNGYYSLELKPLQDVGYEVELTHPDYGNKWWDAKSLKLSRKQRCALSGEFQARTVWEWARHVGKTDSAVTYDFAIFPATLTEDEKRELREALPAGQP